MAYTLAIDERAEVARATLHDGATVALSALLSDRRLTDAALPCLDVLLCETASLLLDVVDARVPFVSHVEVRGAWPPPFVPPLAHEPTEVRGSVVRGGIRHLLAACPSVRTLELRWVGYDVDWAGLERSSLALLDLTHYECVDPARPIAFPRSGCTVCLNYCFSGACRARPDETLAYLTRALAGCTRCDVRWSVGTYDPEHHVPLVRSLRRALRALGRDVPEGVEGCTDVVVRA